MPNVSQPNVTVIQAIDKDEMTVLADIQKDCLLNGVAVDKNFAVQARGFGQGDDSIWTSVIAITTHVAGANTTRNEFNKYSIAVASSSIPVDNLLSSRYDAITPKSMPQRFTLDRPVDVILEINDDKWQALHLFVNEIDPEAPRADSEGLCYFGQGVNNGNVYAPSASQKPRELDGGAILIERSKTILVESVTSLRSFSFSLPIVEGQNVHIDRYRSFSGYGNGDGIDLFCCRDVLIENCFLRNSDDTIAIYGHRWEYFGDTNNIRIQGCTLLPDIAYPIQVGTHGNPAKPETFSNIHVSDIDVLDHEGNQMWYQGCISLNAGDENLIQDVLIEDVRVEKITTVQLFNIRAMKNRIWTTAQGRGIRNVTLRNIELDLDRSKLVYPSQILGYDFSRKVENISFENLKIGGKCIQDGMEKPRWYMVSDYVPMFLNEHTDNGVLWQQLWDRIHTANNDVSPDSAIGNLYEQTEQLKQRLDVLGRKRSSDDDDTTDSLQRSKRRRTSTNAHVSTAQPLHNSSLDSSMLPADLEDALVELFYSHIHPWIPVLHVRQFRHRMRIPEERQKIKTILQAITSVTLHLSDDARLGDAENRSRSAEASRQAVILQSLESFSAEGLQALIMCAFDTIGSGRGPSAWSIVGSMARTVEQLQLSTEDEGDSKPARDAQTLVKRVAFLRPCRDWREAEDRRRVFWTEFLMDRFCSIATGWNICLTSADVKRRFPCEGGLWEEGKPLETPTPFFGVSDPPGDPSNVLPSARPETSDQASLGGFAYCIEATESLNLVTSFFQQELDVTKPHDVQTWLMRFKQLDLRLVQWGIFLPERWREACALDADGNMDPNLTLAHITHNTAVVLLHQGIAYPSQDWQSLPIKLSSTVSAETCMATSVEVSTIASEFLPNMQCVTNPQFAFCLFICGRMLLAHAFYYDIPLLNEFGSLIHSLQIMAHRWNGEHSSSRSNLASKFATRLNHARQAGLQTLHIRQAA
ncbi:hypothetical protein EK21DRAFT_117785 [Setomelanomma holmii]|uniref:Xylanolytic transcriptional activator regulatory domain-containing protein n=1 Tax=Setomelanomma holmii TaxID=210430 RepID=A0A9P4GWT3_9PLEO|nr:hypothetical protein EK21DRAFT_117785 [Setomelanomma holmii]